MKNVSGKSKLLAIVAAVIIIAAAVGAFVPGLKAAAPYVDSPVLTIGCKTDIELDIGAVKAATEAQVGNNYSVKTGKYISGEKAGAVITFADPTTGESVAQNIVNTLNVEKEEYYIISFSVVKAWSFSSLLVTCGCALLMTLAVVFLYIWLRFITRGGAAAGGIAALVMLTAEALPLAVAAFAGIAINAVSVGAIFAAVAGTAAYFALVLSRVIKDRAANAAVGEAAAKTLADTAKTDLITGCFALAALAAVAVSGIIGGSREILIAAVLAALGLCCGALLTRFAAIPIWAALRGEAEAAIPAKRRAKKEKTAAKAKAEKQRARAKAEKQSAKPAGGKK